MELLSHMLNIFNFLGTAKLFSKATAPFYISINNVGGDPISPHPSQDFMSSKF